MTALRARVSFANVGAALALFVALGSGAAIALPGANTVNLGDITTAG